MNVTGQGRVYLHHGDGNVMGKRRQIWVLLKYCLGFPGDSVVKNPPANAGYMGSIPGLGRSPGEGNGNPLQYSCLENPMDGGAWWATYSPWGHKESDTTEQHFSKRSSKRWGCQLFV